MRTLGLIGAIWFAVSFGVGGLWVLACVCVRAWGRWVWGQR